jgi:uncharacterized membrane protein
LPDRETFKQSSSTREILLLRYNSASLGGDDLVPNPRPIAPRRIWRAIARVLTAAFFVLAGANHFANPTFYRSIVPPSFPSPALLVTISGICEIAGGIGLLIRPLRRFAGWGLIALLIAVFPANIFMALHPDAVPGWHIAHWLLWLRLPLQGVFIFWVWYVSREP